MSPENGLNFCLEESLAEHVQDGGCASHPDGRAEPGELSNITKVDVDDSVGNTCSHEDSSSLAEVLNRHA